MLPALRIYLFRRAVLVLLFYFSQFLCLGQQKSIDTLITVPTKNNFMLQAEVHMGKLIKIYPEFPKTNFIDLNEVNASWQVTGKKEWHQLYHYPRIGIAFIYGYLDNNKVLGQNFSLVPNMSFETHKNKRLVFQTRFGMGFSYFTKHYDAISNRTNNVIGSSITNITFLSEDLNFKLTPNTSINVGIATFHCSNGHYQLPNLGANMPVINLGIIYSPNRIPTFYRHDSITKPNKKLKLNVFVGYGRHEFGSATKPTGGPKYPVFQGAVYVSKRYKRICNFQAGLFYTYYTDYYDFIVSQEYFDSQLHLKASVITAFIGNEFIIGKFGLIAQAGINVYTPFLTKYKKSLNDKDITALYNSNKIGIQYYFFDPTLKPKHNLYIGLYMKANFGTADFAQVGIGYTL